MYSILPWLLMLGHVTGSEAQILEHLNATVNSLVSQVGHLVAQLNKTQQDLAHSNATILSLTHKLADSDAHITNLTQQLRVTSSQLFSLDSYCRGHISDLTNRTVRLETPVSFSVRFNNDTVTEALTAEGYGGQRLLKFDIVSNNNGNHYNASTGKFHVPVTGTYAFFLTIHRSVATENTCLQVELVSTRLHPFCYAVSCPSGFTSASNACVVYLRQDEEVFAQVAASQVHDIFGYVHTTFSGMKL